MKKQGVAKLFFPTTLMLRENHPPIIRKRKQNTPGKIKNKETETCIWFWGGSLQCSRNGRIVVTLFVYFKFQKVVWRGLGKPKHLFKCFLFFLIYFRFVFLLGGG